MCSFDVSAFPQCYNFFTDPNGLVKVVVCFFSRKLSLTQLLCIKRVEKFESRPLKRPRVTTRA